MNIKAFKTISLIFPTFNESALIVNTVNEAVAYFEKQGLDYEIIFAADGNDGSMSCPTNERSVYEQAQ